MWLHFSWYNASILYEPPCDYSFTMTIKANHNHLETFPVRVLTVFFSPCLHLARSLSRYNCRHVSCRTRLSQSPSLCLPGLDVTIIVSYCMVQWASLHLVIWIFWAAAIFFHSQTICEANSSSAISESAERPNEDVQERRRGKFQKPECT